MDRERFQLELSPEMAQHLDELKEQIGAHSRAEVIRTALNAYEWLVEQAELDDTVQFCDGEGKVKQSMKVRFLLSPI